MTDLTVITHDAEHMHRAGRNDDKEKNDMRNELLTEAKHNNYRPSSEAERIAREEADNVTRRERFYREWCRHEAAQLERDIAAARCAL